MHAVSTPFAPQFHSQTSVQGHKVQRLDLQEVAKLGRGTDSPRASLDIKQEDQELQGIAHGQTDSKDKDAGAAAGKATTLTSPSHYP